MPEKWHLTGTELLAEYFIKDLQFFPKQLQSQNLNLCQLEHIPFLLYCCHIISL